MNFFISPSADGSTFEVQWLAPGSGEAVATVRGFPTMAAAEQFVQDLLIKVMKAYQKVS